VVRSPLVCGRLTHREIEGAGSAYRYMRVFIHQKTQHEFSIFGTTGGRSSIYGEFTNVGGIGSESRSQES
jgi:hypothetical protein